MGLILYKTVLVNFKISLKNSLRIQKKKSKGKDYKLKKGIKLIADVFGVQYGSH